MSNLKDGIDNVVVRLDNEDATFRVGTPLSGKVMVTCGETTVVRGIRLKIVGRMTILWRHTENGATVEHMEIEDYLDEELTVWAPIPGRPDTAWMFPGDHTYDFSFDLPIDLPDTLDDSRYAKVGYHVKAGVFLTQQRISHSLEEPFFIITCTDPSIPKQSEEDMPDENCSYAVLGGSCLMKKTYIELYMRLIGNYYKLGQEIPVHVEVTIADGGNKNAIKKVTALLVQEAIYTVSPGGKDEARKKERLVMWEHENEDLEDTPEVDGKKTFDLTLKINDRMPLTDYPWCDFIQMGYFVHVVARTHSFYDDIVVKLPIVVQSKDEDTPEDILNEEQVLIKDSEDETEEEKDTEGESQEDSDDGGRNNEGYDDDDGSQAEVEVEDDVNALLDDDDLRADEY